LNGAANVVYPGFPVIQTISGLAPGNHTIDIIDANNCTYSGNTIIQLITEPAQLTTSTNQTNVSCNGGNDGTATVTVGGGTPGYSYSWNSIPIQTTATATNLSAGTYVCTVTDANGCNTSASVTITELSPLTASATPNTSCTGGANGSIL
jgi:hypothetical protein